MLWFAAACFAAPAAHPARWRDCRVIEKDPSAAGHLYSPELEDAAAMKLARSRLRDNIEIRRVLRGFAKAEPQPASQRPAAKGGDARMGWAELVRRGRLPQGGSSSEGGFDGACAGTGCVLNAAVAPPTKRSSEDLRHMPKVALLESRPDGALLQRRQERSPPGGR